MGSPRQLLHAACCGLAAVQTAAVLVSSLFWEISNQPLSSSLVLGRAVGRTSTADEGEFISRRVPVHRGTLQIATFWHRLVSLGTSLH
jgi:hypothetical protein